MNGIDTAEKGSVQEALFHFFGLPIDVIAEPSAWYAYRHADDRRSKRRSNERVMVRFMATSMSGENFGGTCLHIQSDDGWAAYTVSTYKSGHAKFHTQAQRLPTNPPLEPIHWVNVHQTEVTFRTIEKDK